MNRHIDLDDLERMSGGWAEAPAEARGPKILFYGDRAPEPPPWLIRGVLPQKKVGILGGQSGAGKTFVGVALSHAVMTGGEFIDCPVERQGAVLWLAAEGENEIEVRLKAAAIHRTGEDQVGKLPFCTQAFEVPSLSASDAIEQLMGLVEAAKAGLAGRFPGVELALIVIDTLNSAAGFQDENSASETQRVFNTLRKLADASGTLVLVVDHYGKATETGVRGSSAKGAAADAILGVLADKDEISGKIHHRRLTVVKLRGAATGRSVPFVLKPVEVDVWGSTHCGIEWDTTADSTNTATAKPIKPAWTGAGKLLKSCIERMLIEHGSNQQPFGFEGPKVKAVPVKRVRTEFLASYAADNADAKSKAFKRSLADAVSKGLIATREIGASLQDWVWLIELAKPP